MIDWPILVNETERDRLAALALSRPSRVQLIRGPSGIGKSTLATAAGVALAQRGYTTLRVMGMPELQNVPLGAMAPLLASAGASLDEPVTDRLHRLFARASPASAKLVLIIDDGPLLDEISASTIYQLVRVYGLPAIMTARTEHPLTGPLARLVDEGALDITELSGISPSVAGELVLSALGDVDPDSVHTLVELAAGNPLFLRELVIAADQGAATSGSRGLVVDATALPARLRDTIAVRFESLSEPERRLAELIALGEPWPETLLASPRLVFALDRVGLLTRSSSGEVSLSHPLFAETLISLMSDSERGEARRDAAARLATSSRDDHRFRAISLLAATSGEPSPSELAWAASYSHQVDDQERATELARQSIDRSRSLGEDAQFDALVVLADSLAVAGKFEAAEEAFAVATAATTSDEQTSTIITRRGFYLAVQRQRPAEAVRLGGSAIESMVPSAHRDYLAGNLAKWRLMLGEKPTTHSPESESDELTAFNTQLFTLMAAVFASDLKSARSAIEFVRPRAEGVRSVVRHGAQMIDFGEFFVMALDGHIDEAIGYAMNARGGPRDESTGMWNYGLALFTLIQGHTEDAASLAALAVEQLGRRDFLGVRGPAVALLAIASARLGVPAEDFDPELRENVVTDLHAAEAEAWKLGAQGNLDRALPAMSAAISRGIEGRCYAIAAITAHAAVRMGRADAVISQLRTITSATPGGMVHLIGRHAEALVARDAAALLDVGSSLAAAGLTAGAVDASRQAAQLAREGGQDRLARRATLLASSWSGGAGETAKEGGLSEREWDIARSAASRERSREIAERLGLSVRTVDNHLTNIYKKLGVSGRDQLRAELAELNRV